MGAKFLIIAIISILSSYTLAKVDFLSDEFIASINAKQTTWTAGRNIYPNGLSLGQRKRKISMPEEGEIPLNVHEVLPEEIPETFDGRTWWQQCESLKVIRNHGSCDCDWAFAPTEVMSDRICIESFGEIKFNFSPQDVLSCCASCGDCTSGSLATVLTYWNNSGIVSGGDYGSNEGCQPYTGTAFYIGKEPTRCATTCGNLDYNGTYNEDKHFGQTNYKVSADVLQIQTEILTYGPVITAFDLYEDFYSYKSGVYVQTDGDGDGLRVVKILGWGTENGTPYWLVANAWGTDWGDSGFFKILRGENHCRIESHVVGARPRL